MALSGWSVTESRTSNLHHFTSPSNAIYVRASFLTFARAKHGPQPVVRHTDNSSQRPRKFSDRGRRQMSSECSASEERAKESDVQTRRAILLTAATLPLSLPILGQHLPGGFASAAESDTRSATDENSALRGGPIGDFPKDTYPNSIRDDFTASAEALRTEDDMSVETQVDLGATPGAPAGTSVPTNRADPVDGSAEGPLITRKVYFDVSIDGTPAGRIVIGLYGKDVPIGAARFAELAIGSRGISYRRKEFVKVTPQWVQHGGLRAFSLNGEESQTAVFTGGETGAKLEAEMEEISRHPHSEWFKNVPQSVSLVALDPYRPPPKTKLVAKNGKLIQLEEASSPPPNGTEFNIVLQPSPELDKSSLVVGRVVEGWGVVQTLGAMPSVRENTGSPYFRVAKLIGDSRAVVAERGFNRPYSKLMITKCGKLE